MIHWRDSSTWRFFRYALACFLAIVGIVTAVFATVMLQIESDNLEAGLEHIQAVHSPALATSLWITDHGEVRRILDGIAHSRHILGVEVREPDGDVFTAGLIGEPGQRIQTTELLYSYHDTAIPVGTLALAIGERQLRLGVLKAALDVLILGIGLAVVLSAGMAWIFRMTFGRHLASLARFMESDDPDRLHGGFTLAQGRPGRDELQVLVGHFNALRGRISAAMGELRDTIARLTESEMLLARSQAVAQLGSWELDLTANRLTWSDEVYRVFGCEPGEFAASYEAFLGFVHPDDRAAVDAAYTASVRDAAPGYEIEHRIIRKDSGLVRHVHERCVHEQDASGTIVRSTGTVMDITDRKEAEEALRQLNQELEERVRRRTRELEEANRQLEAFGSSVSHDLRAPLRGVTAFSRMLLDRHAQELSEDGRQACGLIHESARTMETMIAGLLEFSRIGRKDLRVCSVDMAALVQAVVTDLRTAGDAGRVDFRVGDLPAALADPVLVRQVWANLLGNAVKYSSGEARPVVDVWADQEDGEVVYHVRDNGAGFDMRHVENIFGVFKRLHTSREFEGSGVGLAIVHQIITRHGGRIQAQGEPGLGATFSFTLGGRRGSAHPDQVAA